MGWTPGYINNSLKGGPFLIWGRGNPLYGVKSLFRSVSKYFILGALNIFCFSPKKERSFWGGKKYLLGGL